MNRGEIEGKAYVDIGKKIMLSGLMAWPEERNEENHTL
jgi:hypothetical protein